MPAAAIIAAGCMAREPTLPDPGEKVGACGPGAEFIL